MLSSSDSKAKGKTMDRVSSSSLHSKCKIDVNELTHYVANIVIYHSFVKSVLIFEVNFGINLNVS